MTLMTTKAMIKLDQDGASEFRLRQSACACDVPADDSDRNFTNDAIDLRSRK